MHSKVRHRSIIQKSEEYFCTHVEKKNNAVSQLTRGFYPTKPLDSKLIGSSHCLLKEEILEGVERVFSYDVFLCTASKDRDKVRAFELEWAARRDVVVRMISRTLLSLVQIGSAESQC